MTKDKPTWGYRLESGAVQARIFTDGKLPKGWKDTPAGMKADGDNG